MKRNLICSLLLFVSVGVSFGHAFAQSYSASSEFDGSVNGSTGVWSYGFKNGVNGTFTAFPLSSLNTSWFNVAGSNVTKNNLGGPVASVPAGELSVRGTYIPAIPFVTPAINQLGVLRFTAPTAATYAFDANWFAGDTSGNSATSGNSFAYFFKNNVNFGPNASATNPGVSYVGAFSLNSGDTLDLAVGAPTNFQVGSNLASNTPVSFKVTVTPELPGALQLIPALIPIGLFLAKRRRAA